MSLLSLLTDQRSANDIVAGSGQHRLTMGQLRAQVAENAHRIRERGARRGLLFCDASDRFVVGLYGLLHAGAEVVLPPNANPGTLQALAGSFDIVVSDRNIADAVVLRVTAIGREAAFAPLDPDLCRIDFYTSGSSGEPKRIAKTLALLEREIADSRRFGDRRSAARRCSARSRTSIYLASPSACFGRSLPGAVSAPAST